VPTGWLTGKDIPESIEKIVDASVVLKAIRAGWDGMLRVAASIPRGPHQRQRRAAALGQRRQGRRDPSCRR